TKKPQIVGDVAITGYGIDQALRVYDGQYVDSLKYWMDNLGWGMDFPTTPADKSIMIADAPFDLLAGGIRVEKCLKWGSASAGDAAWKKFLYNVLHQEGFYRGDVNKDGKPTVTDVVYLINYLFKGGPKPVEFPDQGDVQNDNLVTVTDVVYMINFLFKGGPAPIDRNRWLDKSPFVDPAYKALAVRNPGLFGDPNWVTLGN
ncbi:MAG: dockerin type I domain-containing protein, partial [candidate division Zixibacteria bacterium]|nr:dockerin type I domain-containing protein [candidate division Zixibacteria bacterium]